MNINNKRINYIQYLRAFSVLLVLFYHLKLNLFVNGYLGVDIFFVISGYVITGRLYNNYNSNGKIEIINFFIKRFKRIYPVLIFFLTSVLLTIIFFSPLDYFINRISVTIFSLFGSSNLFYLFSKKDYFATVFNDPLNHTWSLGVEEQFYLIFPILFSFLIFLVNKRQKNLIIILILFSLLGLFFTYFNHENLKLIFYSPIYRFWQFLFGSVIFLISTKYSKKNKYLSLVFLAFMIGIIFSGDTFIYFQRVLLISICSSFLIYLCDDKYLIQNNFANNFFIYLGNISYSFYLWHLPIIYFYDLYFDANIYRIVFIFFITFLFSSFSYHSIEQKFRYFKFKNIYQRRYFFLTFIFSLIVMAVFFLNIINKDKDKSKFEVYIKNLVYKINFLENKLDYSNRTVFYKFSINNNPIYKYCAEDAKKFQLNEFGMRKECLKNDNRKRLFFIIGNSHTANFIPMFDNLGSNLNFYYLHNTVLKFEKYPKLISKLSEKFDEVIFTTNIDNNKHLKKYFDSFDQLDKNISVLILGTVPNVDNSQKPLEHFIKQKNYLYDVNIDLKERKIYELYKDIEENINLRKRKIFFYKPYRFICPNEQCYAYNKEKDILTHRDDGHLTKEGSILLVKSFKAFLEKQFINF